MAQDGSRPEADTELVVGTGASLCRVCTRLSVLQGTSPRLAQLRSYSASSQHWVAGVIARARRRGRGAPSRYSISGMSANSLIMCTKTWSSS